MLEQKEQISELLSIESDLNKELDEYKDRLEVAEEDIDELKKDLERAGNQSVSRRDRSTRSTADEDGEDEIQDLRKQLSAQIIMLSTRAEEKEDLQDEIEQLKGELGTLESELDRLEGERERERRESGSDDGEDKKSSIEVSSSTIYRRIVITDARNDVGEQRITGFASCTIAHATREGSRDRRTAERPRQAG